MRPRSMARSPRRRLTRCLVVLAGIALLAGGDFPAALAQGGNASQIFSQEEICRRDFQTGQEYLKNRRLSEAAQAFRAVVEACPDMIEAYLNLGLIQVQMREYEEAIDTYYDALDEDPGNLDVKEALAYALSSAGELDEALGLYLELHTARPEKTDLLRNLAFVYKQKGMVAEAVMLYKRLIELDAADPQMVSEAGSLALEQKLFLPAVTFYQKLYASSPDDINTLSILGGYYFKIKFYGEAVEYYDKILEMGPDNPNALMHHQIRGLCLKNIGEYARAAEDYEYVVGQKPEDVNNYCNLSFIYKDAGLYRQAIEAVQRGLDHHPDAGCLYYAWGQALEVWASSLVSDKRFDEAIEKYREAKTKFQRVVDTNDPTFRNAARQQLERMDALSERARALQDKEQQGL